MRRHTSIKNRDENGASAVEYGLLIAGIAALVVMIIYAFGGVVSHLFSDSCGTVSNYMAHSSHC